MRVGFNPNKDKELQKSDFFHQVIVPVYIPNQEGYFKDSFQILQFCLDSLFKTSHAKTYFTIVNNGSCAVVIEYLNQLHQEGKVHEIIQTTSIGKLNAILKGVTGHQFDLITISDADVLFLNDWQKATYDVFDAFPKAGVVCTTPNPKTLRYYTGNLIWDNLLSKSIKFSKVQDKEAMLAFAKSVGNMEMFKEIHVNKSLTISNKNVTALIGAGHFVATYKGIIFNDLCKRYSAYSLGGDSEQYILDKPASNLGLWRLSTQKNYTFHMGNVKEDWMQKASENLIDNKDNLIIPAIKQVNVSNFSVWFKTEFFSRILFRKPIWQLFLRYKGLTKEEASTY